MSIYRNLFLNVGAMKTGTTWLYALLSQHPELHFTPEKEIHYFNHRYVDDTRLSAERRLSEARNRYLRNFDPATARTADVRKTLRWVGAYLDEPVDDYWYRNLFQLEETERFSCDFSNLNAVLPADVWPRIEERCDRLRVLFTMRDPVKRLWSHTKFHQQFIGEVGNLQNWTQEDYMRFLRQQHVWEHAEYGSILRNLKAGLSEPALKVIFYEDMHADQRGTLASIENFLGIAPMTYLDEWLEKRFTESARIDMPDFFPDLVAEDIRRIYSEVEAEGLSIPARWTRF